MIQLCSGALAVLLASSSLISLGWADVLIIVIYFAMVLGIGYYLSRYTKTGDDFFLAGRKMTMWIAGLAFISANLGSLELMGWAASAYQYGILATHWYWIGAIPAMLFLAIVMMPFYYISRTHSVPGYLKLRFGEGARMLAAISFALMTILMSGVNMFSMALVMKVIIGWDINFSIWVSSITVLVYVVLGGLLSAMFNEVLQFVLIWAGALLVPIIGLMEVGGWKGMVARIHENFPHGDYTHLWSTLGHFKDNPMGIHWTGIVFGLGFIISFGYWTTDFLVVQRVLSAKDLRSAKMAPIIGSAFKMLVPFIVILPGLIGLAVMPGLVGQDQAAATGQPSYNEILPLMMARYLGPGLLGLGITALIAGFMSGMAGNITAFSTVWTYDIYKPIHFAMTGKEVDDRHYVKMGRWATIVGIIVSIGTAYLVEHAASIMDYVQALFSFFIAPLFGTVILGMLWKRATAAGGFWGLLAGTLSSIGMWVWVRVDPRALSIIAGSPDAKAMAEDMYRALWSWLICVAVTVIVSLATRPKPEAELVGLVRGCTEIPSEGHLPLVKRPIFWAGVVFAAFLILQIIFW
ncbi:MAG: sodium:solute symporter family protein [Thermoflavifilum sp.]|jgi:SSS family solute:Na+ symporter|uniref:sodium:solute symporter family protein n=1 Tax=Thermoflavifilum sp. TaxID=1968839 RepID=UPI0018A50C93|nr:sodium:solute symporter family protein [Thermoflavifilum sp.]QOR75439.1 MAG: sodium:solute symporter family protein [Thermoflavifilum sp.]